MQPQHGAVEMTSLLVQRMVTITAGKRYNFQYLLEQIACRQFHVGALSL